MNRFANGPGAILQGLAVIALGGLVSIRGGLWLYPKHPIVGSILVVSGGLAVLGGVITTGQGIGAASQTTTAGGEPL